MSRCFKKKRLGKGLRLPKYLGLFLLQVQMVSSMRIGRNVNYRILDIDWCTSDKVVLASDDGCIRVLEMAMKSASYRMDEQDLTGEPVNKECVGVKDKLHIEV